MNIYKYIFIYSMLAVMNIKNTNLTMNELVSVKYTVLTGKHPMVTEVL